MSVAGKPNYQETEAGQIPEHWTAMSLGSVASSRKGKGVAKPGVPCIELEHIEPEVGRLLGWDGSGAQASIKTAFSKGDVLFGKLRPYLRKYAVAPFDGICTTEILAIHPKERASDTRFLFYLMQGDGIFSTVEALSYGTKMPRVSWTDLSDIVVGIPPLPEQKKIAAILAAVDGILGVISRQIEATQTLKQGLMQTLFSRGVGIRDANGRWVPHTQFKDSPIGEIPQSWKPKVLEDLTIENITYGVVQPGENRDDGVPLVRGGDIKGGKIANNLRTVSTEVSKQFNRTVLQGGELLVSLVGYPGETAVVPGHLVGANIARQAGMVRTGSISMSEFIHCYLASPMGRACLLGGMIGSAQQVINLKALREVYVPMPPLVEREKISSICEAVFAKLDVLEQKQTHFQTLKRGLLQKLLTGEWQVTLGTHQETAAAA
jgi:type I restriction enzyme S subunit